MIRETHQVLVIEEKNQEVFHLKYVRKSVLMYLKPLFLVCLPTRDWTLSLSVSLTYTGWS